MTLKRDFVKVQSTWPMLSPNHIYIYIWIIIYGAYCFKPLNTRLKQILLTRFPKEGKS